MMNLKKLCGLVVVLIELPIALTLVVLPTLMATHFLLNANRGYDVIVSILLVYLYVDPNFKRILRGFVDDFRLFVSEW